MTEKRTYGVDCILVYSWDYWDRQVTGFSKLPEDYKDDERNKAAEPPYTLPNDGPIEKKLTETAGELRDDSIYAFEVCPKCDSTLHIYGTREGGRKIYRCKNCFVKLKMSQMGWIEDTD